MDHKHRIAHRVAKTLVMLVVLSMMLWNNQEPSIVLQCAAVVVWFWGYAPLYWALELLLGTEHDHDFFE